MPERVLPMRRSSPHPDDAGGDCSPAATSSSAAAATSLVDESKTKKQSLSSILTRLTNHLAKLHLSSPCACPFLLLCLAFLLLVPTLIHLSRRVVCVSDTFDPVSRSRFFGFNSLESDFGFLGVPWSSYQEQHVRHGFDHSFGLWFMARWLKLDIMIESGAFKGHSTWVLRQAMPDTRIISVTPRHPEKYLKKGPAYVDGNCTYFAGKDFVDFGSMDWKAVMRKHGITDLTRVLIFFDDHQNELKRLKQALKAGFQHMIFEDNYDTGTGDHYSLRQICDQDYIRGGGHSCFKDSDEARIRTRRKKFWEKAVDMNELCGPDDAWWGVRGYVRDNFNHSNTHISSSKHFQNSRLLESVLDVYWELPPVAGPSLTHQSRYDPARTVPPIVEDGQYGLFQRLRLSRLDNSVFNGYTQMNQCLSRVLQAGGKAKDNIHARIPLSRTCSVSALHAYSLWSLFLRFTLDLGAAVKQFR